jgi:hypothetical protein
VVGRVYGDPDEFRDIALPPAVIVEPGQPVATSPFGVATTTPLGNVSVNQTPGSGAAFGFVILKVNVEVPPGATFVGLNVLVTVGGTAAGTTVAPKMLT